MKNKTHFLKRKTVHANEDTIIWLWVILVCLSIGLVISMWFFYSVILFEREANLNETDCMMQGVKLQEGSDDLTNAAREFVMTGNPRYLQAYWYEVDIRKSRDQVITHLDQLTLSKDEKKLLITAKRNSDSLVATETKAMKLIFLAMGVPELSMYPPVRDYKLFPTALELKPEAKINLAQKILFDDQYLQDKASIMDPIDKFRHLIEARVHLDTEQAKRLTELYFTVMFGLSILILIALISVVWLRGGLLKDDS